MNLCLQRERVGARFIILSIKPLLHQHQCFFRLLVSQIKLRQIISQAQHNALRQVTGLNGALKSANRRRIIVLTGMHKTDGLKGHGFFIRFEFRAINNLLQRRESLVIFIFSH